MCFIDAEGAKAEEAYAKDGTLPDPDSTDNPEFKIVLGLIKASIPKDPTKWSRCVSCSMPPCIAARA
jgi:adenosylhomocysteinase